MLLVLLWPCPTIAASLMLTVLIISNQHRETQAYVCCKKHKLKI